MRTFNILTTSALIFFAACNGQTGIQSIFAEERKAEEPKTVRAYAPEMNNMEMLSMTQMPGWRILAGTQWIGNAYCNSIRGVNDDLKAGMFKDGNRNYTQMPMVAQSGTSDGKTVYLNYMSAPDYLDYVFRRQFPNTKGARRTKLKTLDLYSEDDRRKLEEYRVQLYNVSVEGYRHMPGGENTFVRQVTADCAEVEYQWLQDGDTIVHSMGVILFATYTDYRSQYLNHSAILWAQNALNTVTFPAKHRRQVEEDVKQMISSIQINDAYTAALDNIVMQGMQREDAIMRRRVNEMAQAEVNHQRRMTQMMQETNEYVSNVQRESFANQRASQNRISEGWTDAITGVNRFIGSDGKVVQVPVSAGSHAWQSADGGTIVTSDSYLFKAVDNLYDKDGRITEFREMQLLK